MTEIRLDLSRSSMVVLKVYNIPGQEVENLVSMEMSAGFHSVKWDARNVGSRTYIYKIVAGEFTAVKKMVVIK